MSALPLQAAAAKAVVVVVGGGFAGVSAARLLKRLLPAARIVLIEKDPVYHSAPYSNFVLTGLWPSADLHRDYRVLAQEGIEMISVAAVRVDNRAVVLANGNRLSFDRVVVAPGIDFDYNQLPGASPESMPHAYQGGAQVDTLRRQLMQMPDNGTVIIIPPVSPYRCSPAPYDRAGMVAHYLERHKPQAKILLLDQKEQFAQQTLFANGWERYYRGRIEWRSAEAGGAVERLDVARRVVYTEFGEEYGDVINYIPPQRAAGVAVASDLTDASGWCPVEPFTMESRRRKGVYVIGDAATVTPAPKTASCAVSQAETAARAIAAELGNGVNTAGGQLQSVCFSHIAPDIAFSETGDYQTSVEAVSVRQVILTSAKAGEQELNKIAAAGIGWNNKILRQVFG